MTRIEHSEFMATVVSRPFVQKLEFDQGESFFYKSTIDPRIRLLSDEKTFNSPTWLNLQVT